MPWWVLIVGAASAATLDLNDATVDELDTLPGLGPVKARAIVEWRSEHGPCSELADLADVPGIGAATLAALVSWAHCGPGDEQAPTTPPDAPDDPTAPAASVLVVDINSADADALQQLPGIVGARAEAIVADRKRNGLFSSCDDLVRVEGIGPATVSTFGEHCVAR